MILLGLAAPLPCVYHYRNIKGGMKGPPLSLYSSNQLLISPNFSRSFQVPGPRGYQTPLIYNIIKGKNASLGITSDNAFFVQLGILLN